MLAKPTPGLTPFPFPTAFPGLGATYSNPVSGSHTSNTAKYRQPRIRSRHGHTTQRTPNSQFLWANGNPNPTQPTIQTYNHQILAYLTKWWKGILSPTQRLHWATLAASTRVTNMFGQSRYLSGFGFFIRANRLYIQLTPHDVNHPSWWGGPGPWGNTPFFVDAPPAWPALFTSLFVSADLYLVPPTSSGDPSNELNIQWASYGIYGTSPLALTFWISLANAAIYAPKQGPLVQACQTPLNTSNPSTILYAGLQPALIPAAAQVGRQLTIAWRTANVDTGGESPTQYKPLTIQAWPY